jgi:5-hydroxyisourate hydrolase
MPAKLSTHVLDLTTGQPAVGMQIRLIHDLTDAGLLQEARTNADGRTDAPLLADGAMKPGPYSLQFFVRDYFTRKGVACDFLNVVSIDFQITDASASYHVPLLVTPWSYSTYRGS